MKDNDVKFFRPLWIRVLVTAVVVVWFVVEIVLGHDPLWIGITGIGVAYCAWNFFLRFPKDAPGVTTPDEPPKP